MMAKVFLLFNKNIVGRKAETLESAKTYLLLSIVSTKLLRLFDQNKFSIF